MFFPSNFTPSLPTVSWCFFPFLFSVRSVRTLNGKRIVLRCLAKFMLLELDLRDIPTIQPASLHLKHHSCKPHEVATTKAIFRVPFQGCGTTRGTIENYITFSNVVENSRVENDSSSMLDSIAPDLHVPFSCRYRRKYKVVIKEGQQREDRDKNEPAKRKNHSTGKKREVHHSRSHENVVPIRRVGLQTDVDQNLTFIR